MNKKVRSRVIEAREHRELMLDDIYRPGFHFAVPEDIGIPGDPNGCFYAKGRYHLMYLYLHASGGFRWGHVSSHNLVNWRHHKDALVPAKGDDGYFSGGAFVDDDGRAYLSYWQLSNKNGVKDENGGLGISLAVSADEHYDNWEKMGTAVIPSTGFGVWVTEDESGNPLILGASDPSNIWKKDGKYYMQTGNLQVLDNFGRKQDSDLKYKGDMTFLFESEDLKTWKFKHRFYQRDLSNRWTDETEDDMCPSFLPLPTSKAGGKFSGKYLQLFISHNKGCQYYVGEYKNDRFYPENHGRMTHADNSYFAPEALVDKKGRQIMWVWLNDNLERNEEEKIGWSGVFGLPRVLWYEEDMLKMAPAPELEMLRYNAKKFKGEVVKGRPLVLDGINPESCEIKAELTTGAKLTIESALDPKKFTAIYYDKQNEQLIMDNTKSGTKGRIAKEYYPLKLKEGEKLMLDLFLDRSVIEVYANEKAAICRRNYVKYEKRVLIIAEAGTECAQIDYFEMFPNNPY